MGKENALHCTIELYSTVKNEINRFQESKTVKQNKPHSERLISHIYFSYTESRHVCVYVSRKGSVKDMENGE